MSEIRSTSTSCPVAPGAHIPAPVAGRARPPDRRDLPTDPEVRDRQQRISAATLYRISQLFEISPTFFFEGLTSQGETDEAATPSPEVVQSSLALGRIPDGEIRHRLRLLIDALAPGRDN